MKMIAALVVWALCFAGCEQLPATAYPAAELPPGGQEEVSEEPEIARGPHGQVPQEDGEKADEETAAGEPLEEAAEEIPEIFLPEPFPEPEQPAETDEENPEVFLSDPAPEPDPPQITEIPLVPAEADRQEEIPPDPVSPLTPPDLSAAPESQLFQPPSSQPPPVPPPTPKFIRPSEPAVAEENAGEAPVLNIPDLPVRSASVPDDAPVYSRTVNAFVGQYIEIPFRGSNWVYLGELGSRRGVYYDSRRIDSEGMIFVFRANEEGSYSLKFNRQDFIRDYVINDYVQVNVAAPPEITGSTWNNTAVVPDRVYANPRWPPPSQPAANETNQAVPSVSEAPANQAVPAATETPANQAAASVSEAPVNQAAPATSETAAGPPAVAGDTNRAAPPVRAVPGDADTAGQTDTAAVDQAPPVPEAGAGGALPAGSPPDLYLAKAKEEYDAGRIAGALGTLDQLRAAYPEGSDEAYWLYGQALEAAGPDRDIRLALDYYRRLVREYPQSSRYDAANRRIVYLERFYFNIR